VASWILDAAPRKFLQHIELRPPAIVEVHELAIQDGSLGQAVQHADDVWKMRRLDLGVEEVFALTFRITEDNVRLGYVLF
jgi:hypothetical protein